LGLDKISDEDINMKKSLCACLCLLPVLAFAQSPFDGTWRTNMSESKLSQKPYTFSVSNGMYDCDSCAPKINVKADGQDQSVSGQPYDTISIRVEVPGTIHVVTKKNGKTTSDSTRTVSRDGNSLGISSTNHPADGSPPFHAESMWTRVSDGPAGSDKTSGSWRVQDVNEDSAGLTSTWKVSGDEVTMSTATGESWQAKIGGGESPVNGIYANETVSVKKLGPSDLEITYKRDGKVYVVDRVTVAADGKKMTTVSDNKWLGRTSTFVDEKQ
jgi:hypothetical protein